MSDNFRINVNSIGEIKTSEFVDNNTGKLKSGIIKLKNKEYTVNFDNGKIDVHRKKSFFNYFSRSKSSLIKEHLIRKMAGAQFVQNQNYNFFKEKLTSGALKGKQVLMYGMGDVRDNAQSVIERYNNANPNNKTGLVTTIDNYNASIGVEWELFEKNPVNILNSIADGSIQVDEKKADLLNDIDTLSDEQTRKEWKAFLKQNVGRVDIFQKLANYMVDGLALDGSGKKTTGWAHEVRKYGDRAMLKSFILKQLSPNDRKDCAEKIDTLVDCLKTMVLARKSGTLTQEVFNDVLKAYFPEHDKNRSSDFYAARRFKEILTTAFFRQTSKLGIEFFQKKGVPIVFQWSKWNGQNLLNKEGTSEINDKWWLNGYQGSTKNKYGPITYSEMRHVQRLTNKVGPENMNILKVKGYEEKLNNF